jgi:hypothetical protein
MLLHLPPGLLLLLLLLLLFLPEMCSLQLFHHQLLLLLLEACCAHCAISWSCPTSTWPAPASMAGQQHTQQQIRLLPDTLHLGNNAARKLLLFQNQVMERLNTGSTAHVHTTRQHYQQGCCS